MPGKLDLTGNIYGELVVTEMLYGYKYNNKKPRTYCRCCSQDGDEVIVRADALQSGATRSMKGAGKTGKKANISGMKFGLLTVVEPTDKRASNGSVIWKCMCDCGKSTEVSVGNLMRCHTLSCGCRHQSKWEMFIGDYLTLLNVTFQPQKRFNDCRNKRQTDTLPFDFYLPDYDICIEYDGEHHFHPIEMWGGHDKFLIYKENDGIKNEYCKNHNITLLRLPYTLSKEDIKNEILNILNPVTITA
jgi:very-short-patch-repair endonuclease